MKTLYIPVSDSREVKQFISELEKQINNYSKISLTSTIQFVNQIKEVSKLLINHEVMIDKPVLGCSEFTTDADAIVIITTGEFHALNIAVKTGKPVFILSPEGVSSITQERINEFKKKQAIRVSKVIDAKIIGVLVSTKPGQAREKLGREIVEKLRKQGKQAYIFVANELSPSQLNDYPVNAWINTACPRIVEDTLEKPIANWNEVKNHL